LKSPAFSFYPKDFMADTILLNTEQVGAYWLLCCAAWVGLPGFEQGYLPSDTVSLAAITRLAPERWGQISPAVMAHFRLEDGRYFHKRLLQELHRQQQKSQTAKGSAERRWNGCERIAKALPTQGEGNAAEAAATANAKEDRESPRGIEFDPPLAVGFSEAFTTWTNTLPAAAASHAKATPQRRQKYEARRREGYSHEQIVAALKNYVHDDWAERLTDARARDFATLLRDGGQVEKFSQLKPGGSGSKQTMKHEDGWTSAVAARSKPLVLPEAS